MRDGSTVRGTPEAVGLMVDIEQRMAGEQSEWIANLRANGVKAAHPDDGWVDRDRSPQRVHLEYPQFNDGLDVGDLLALGWPFAKTRIVRVTAIEDGFFGMRYFVFEPLPKPDAPRPARRWWRR